MTEYFLCFDDEKPDTTNQQKHDILDEILRILEREDGADYGAKWTAISDLANQKIREMTQNIEEA